MPVDILVGTQWGDEGKGKLIDVLTRDVDMVVRFQGGNNAGHTVEIGDEHYVLHLVPSGIFRPNVVNVIGNGLVVDVLGLVEESRQKDSRSTTSACRTAPSSSSNTTNAPTRSRNPMPGPGRSEPPNAASVRLMPTR